jgi:hypothetical protein
MKYRVRLINRCDGLPQEATVELSHHEKPENIPAIAAAEYDRVGGNMDPEYAHLFNGYLDPDWADIFWHDFVDATIANLEGLKP